MDFLKKFWPISFKERTEVSQLVIAVIIQALLGWGVGAVLGVVAGVLRALVPGALGMILAAPLTLIGSLIGMYFTAGIVFTFLSYFKVLK